MDESMAGLEPATPGTLCEVSLFHGTCLFIINIKRCGATIVMNALWPHLP